MEQITDLTQIVGKTVTKAREGYGDVVMIGFSDDTFIYLKAEEDDGAWLCCNEIFNPDYYIVGNDILVDFGFTSQEEIEAKARDCAEKSAQIAEEQDRAEWERLSTKFANRMAA